MHAYIDASVVLRLVLPGSAALWHLALASGLASLGAALNVAIGPRAAELTPLLDPRGHGTLSAAADDARLAFAGGLHTVFLALLVLAGIGVVLALRLPAHDFEARAAEATESDRLEAAGQ